MRKGGQGKTRQDKNDLLLGGFQKQLRGLRFFWLLINKEGGTGAERKARQDKGREGETREEKGRYDKIRPGNAREHKTRQVMKRKDKRNKQ